MAGTHVDNLVYTGSKAGSKATLLASITNSSNWSSDDINAYDLSPGGTSFTGSNPIFSLWALPVHLVAFTGSITSLGHQLNWEVQNEEHFDHYEIESSADARTYRNIGRVTADNKEHYSFLYTGQAASRSYYRLKMVDADGRNNYSKVIVLLNPGDGRNILLYPNPVSSTLNISSGNSIRDIRLLDETGRQLLHRVVNGNTITVDIRHLPPGLYLVQMNTGDRIVTEKIVKD